MDLLLVGLGRWGEKHLRVLSELGVNVWLADPAASRRQWAMSQGIDRARVTADFRSLLACVDAVDVVTPADSQRPVAEASLAAGRHCFVEKPLAVSVNEGRGIAAAAEASHRVVQVGHIFRFHPVTSALRTALAAGRIGRVRYLLHGTATRARGRLVLICVGLRADPSAVGKSSSEVPLRVLDRILRRALDRPPERPASRQSRQGCCATPVHATQPRRKRQSLGGQPS